MNMATRDKGIKVKTIFIDQDDFKNEKDMKINIDLKDGNDFDFVSDKQIEIDLDKIGKSEKKDISGKISIDFSGLDIKIKKANEQKTKGLNISIKFDE